MANYKDFANEFMRHPDTDDILTKTGELAVRQALRNLFFAEKPFHPEIGINLRKLLFENLNPIVILALQRKIGEVIQIYEPRAKISSINIEANENEDGTDIAVFYSIVGHNKIQKINLFLERLR